MILIYTSIIGVGLFLIIAVLYLNDRVERIEKHLGIEFKNDLDSND